ncbi:MAG: hypothetical protein ACREP9_12145 [Candidatus Dormibacteraceae bacterium]
MPLNLDAGAEKRNVLAEFESAAARLRAAARATYQRGRVPSQPSSDWSAREVLAHIALWAIQATQHFSQNLPPVDYGNTKQWPALRETFDHAFEFLIQPDQAIPEIGWSAVTRAGVTLPLPHPDSPVEHAWVDDAFNAAAIALVEWQSFAAVLDKTEFAHRKLAELLRLKSSADFAPNSYLYRRMKLVIAHHEEHISALN